MAGSDEDALTFGLGFLLAHDPIFCAKLVRSCSITLPKAFKRSYSIHLQEVTEPGFGRRDIVVEADGTRIVLEAKIGGTIPTAHQLLKYAAECNLWNRYATRAIIALTQVELPPATREKVRVTLSKQGVCFYHMQWHQILDLVIHYKPSDDSKVSRYLFHEFEHYKKWSEGLSMLRKRAEEEGFLNDEVRLLFLDRPICIRTTPLSKANFNKTGASKPIPNQIPKGFSLGFDDLLKLSRVPSST